jgi:hypothetical protein
MKNLFLFSTKTESNMKQTLLFLIVFIPFFCFSQDVLTYKSGGRIFNSSNQKIAPEAVRGLLINNQRALALYESGKTKQTVGNILLYGGLTTFIAQHLYLVNKAKENGINYEKANNVLYFVGAAMVVIAIPIKIGFSKKIKKSVALINEDFKNPKTSFNIESTSFISNANGLGFSITF